MFDSATLEDALQTLGQLLASRNQHFELVAIGGGSLLLLRLLPRPTKDLDIVARVEAGIYVSAEPLPEPLVEAVKDTGTAMNLGPQWLNGGPAAQLMAGLPPGFSDRLQTKRYGNGLTLHIASRFDQICFKLFASVDQGPRSKHFADLKYLTPTVKELRTAADWVKTQDASEGFAADLHHALATLERRLDE